MKYKARIKERGNDTILEPCYVGDVIDENFLVKFWGLDQDDVEWYEIIRED